MTEKQRGVRGHHGGLAEHQKPPGSNQRPRTGHCAPQQPSDADVPCSEDAGKPTHPLPLPLAATGHAGDGDGSSRRVLPPSTPRSLITDKPRDVRGHHGGLAEYEKPPGSQQRPRTGHCAPQQPPGCTRPRTSGVLSACAPCSRGSTRCENSNSNLLDGLTPSEKAEAKISLPELGDNDRVITRGKLSEVWRIHRDLAASLADKYKDQLDRLKVDQAAWRRSHNLLVRRKSRGITEDHNEQAVVPQTRWPVIPKSSPAVSGGGGARSASPVGGGRAAATAAASGRLGHDDSNTVDTDDPTGPCVGGRCAALPAAGLGGVPGSRTGGESSAGAASVAFVSEPASPPDASPCSPELRVDQGSDEAPAVSLRRTFSKSSDASTSHQDSKEAAALQGIARANLMLSPGTTLLGRSRESVAVPSCKCDFDISVEMARKHNLPVDDVKQKHAEFCLLDQSQHGVLSEEEFYSFVRQKCSIAPGDPIPAHLLNRHWTNLQSSDDGTVSFEEYLLWGMTCSYAEEMLVTDLKERELRHVARKNGFLLPDVERIKVVFDRYDGDSSGNIDEGEFRDALFALMNVRNPSDVSQKKLQRYWREVDSDRSGSISFEEFLLWYFNFFCGGC